MQRSSFSLKCILRKALKEPDPTKGQIRSIASSPHPECVAWESEHRLELSCPVCDLNGSGLQSCNKGVCFSLTIIMLRKKRAVSQARACIFEPLLSLAFIPQERDHAGGQHLLCTIALRRSRQRAGGPYNGKLEPQTKPKQVPALFCRELGENWPALFMLTKFRGRKPAIHLQLFPSHESQGAHCCRDCRQVFLVTGITQRLPFPPTYLSSPHMNKSPRFWPG